MKTNINFSQFSQYNETLESLNIAFENLKFAQISNDFEILLVKTKELQSLFFEAYNLSKVTFNGLELAQTEALHLANRAKQLFNEFQKIGREKGVNYTVELFCAKLGIDRTTFYQKSKNHSWNESDLQVIESFVVKEKTTKNVLEKNPTKKDTNKKNVVKEKTTKNVLEKDTTKKDSIKNVVEKDTTQSEFKTTLDL